MTREGLREKVAREMIDAVGAVVDADEEHFYLTLADAAIALCMEEAAKVAEDMPINGHGNLAVNPYAAAKQVSAEIAAAIRALKDQDTT